MFKQTDTKFGFKLSKKLTCPVDECTGKLLFSFSRIRQRPDKTWMDNRKYICEKCFHVDHFEIPMNSKYAKKIIERRKDFVLNPSKPVDERKS